MNENIDLIKILKDCPNEWNLWSPLFGEVKFLRIFGDYIEVIDKIGTQAYFDKLGRYITTYETVNSCMLFPSKDQMEWSKFTAPWYKKDKLVEPKFKVGDWVISSVLGTARIMGVNDSNEYQLEYIDGKQEFSSIDYVNYTYDKWTIKDAKDGDVLCCKSGWICIFKTLNNHTNTFSSYCFMDSDKWFFDRGFDGHTLDKKFINAYNGEIYPATKEQRDLLFQKMKEAYYKWDAGKKELKKVKPKFKIGDWIITPENKVLQITSIGDTTYGFNNESHYWAICYCDEQCRFWTIKDAKDGDILANDHHILILKELVYDWSSNGTPYSVKAYCGIKPNGNFEIGKDNWSFCGTLHIHPATKEQRDTLMKAMNDARYEWDMKKKELKKLVPNRFDPKTLKPFDKILVRRSNENHDVWFPDFVSDPPDDTSNKTLCMCIMDDMAMVIPYNDETKHLVGTTDEAPEFYRYWED